MTQPLVNQSAPWRSVYPFDSHWLDVDGSRLHYVDERPAAAGKDETLLFVHGNPTWSFHWRRLIADQRPARRCVAPDALGCGLSDDQPRPLALADHIANLVRLIDALDLQGVTLVAQDWGGAIGLGALLQRQSRFERIVLLNTGAFPPWFIPWRIRVCRWPLVGKLAVQGGNAFSRAALTMTLARRQGLPAEVAAGYLAPYATWRRRAAVYQFVRDIPLGPEHPTWQVLADIESGLGDLATLPKLLIWGEQDWCFTTECLDRFVTHWPAAEVLRIADGGHWIVEDAYEEVSQRIRVFLAKVPLPAAAE